MMKLEMEQMMKGNIIKRDDPRYIEAVKKPLPTSKDLLEVAMIENVQREMVSTPWAKNMYGKLRRIVVENWKDAFLHRKNSEYVHNITQEGIKEAATVANASIKEGEENIDGLKKARPVLIVSNHIGTWKPIRMSADELRSYGVSEQAVHDLYYPRLTFYMPFYPISRELGNNTYEASFEEPGELGELSRATGSIDVPPKEVCADRTNFLTESTRELFKQHSNATLVSFPEGGTTGKRNGGKLYDLGKFYTGSFLVAANLDVSVLPVVQYFNPDSGFELGIFEPFVPEKNMPKEYYENLAESTRGKMQVWLDQRKQASGVPSKP